MEVYLEQILGTWRHINGNIIIDFNIRNKNFGEEFTKAMFTIYQREPQNQIIYEWHAEIEIVNSEGSLPKIQINEIHKTDEKPEYENLTIWMYATPTEMFLQLGNGDRICFNKLGTFFS